MTGTAFFFISYLLSAGKSNFLNNEWVKVCGGVCNRLRNKHLRGA